MVVGGQSWDVSPSRRAHSPSLPELQFGALTTCTLMWKVYNEVF